LFSIFVFNFKFLPCSETRSDKVSSSRAWCKHLHTSFDGSRACTIELCMHARSRYWIWSRDNMNYVIKTCLASFSHITIRTVIMMISHDSFKKATITNLVHIVFPYNHEDSLYSCRSLDLMGFQHICRRFYTVRRSSNLLKRRNKEHTWMETTDFIKIIILKFTYRAQIQLCYMRCRCQSSVCD